MSEVTSEAWESVPAGRAELTDNRPSNGVRLEDWNMVCKSLLWLTACALHPTAAEVKLSMVGVPFDTQAKFRWVSTIDILKGR